MINRRHVVVGGIAATASLIPTPALASTQTARIIVSLADNVHQGIVPIKASLGNGQDPRNNLYWGALYGVKSYFKQSAGWNVRSQPTDNPVILDKLSLWQDNDRNGEEVTAEAWDGSAQKSATEQFMQALVYTNDDLTIFVGHNPLMDVEVPMPKIEPNRLEYNKARNRKFAVISCQSRSYFEDRIKAAGHVPYVLTAGNMAPEAYVVDAIIRAWVEGKPAQTAREYAAEAYAKYQKIPIKNANWLFGV